MPSDTRTMHRPPLQNIPIRSDLGRRLRAALIGQRSRLEPSVDYVTLELRLMATITKKRHK